MINHQVEYYKNGNIKEECWKNAHGWYHREDGPAYIKYYNNGKIMERTWFSDGELHRIDGPAYESFADDGYVKIWYKNGLCHNDDGPAFILFDRNDNIVQSKWWWNDHIIDNEIRNIFGYLPHCLTKDQIIILKLSLPEKYFTQ